MHQCYNKYSFEYKDCKKIYTLIRKNVPKNSVINTQCEEIKKNYIITKKRAFPFGTYNGKIDKKIIDKVFDFAYAMTLGKKGEFRRNRSGGIIQRSDLEIFINAFQGKLGECAVYNKICTMLTPTIPRTNISSPDFKVAPLGKWDEFDLSIKDKFFSVKSTKHIGNLLLLEKNDWNTEANTQYEGFILVRIAPKNNDKNIYTVFNYNIIDNLQTYLYTNQSATNPIKKLLKNFIDSYKWYYDIPGFITNATFKNIIKDGIYIDQGSMLQDYTHMDVNNYYIESGDMQKFEDFEKVFSF